MVLLMLLAVVATASACPGTCQCDEVVTTCYLWTCEIELPYIYTSELNIHGRLCSHHRRQLHEDTYKTTIIILHDDYCLNLENCL